MAEPLLEVRSLRKRFGGLTATDDVSLRLHEGELLAIIGPNGAGKTTLIAQLQGELRPDSGAILLSGAEITHLSPPERAHRGVARSFQITSIFPDFTALENVAMAVQAHAGHSFRFFRPAASEPELVEPAAAALARVGLAQRAAVPAQALAHGEKRQLELAMALAAKPKVMLLDEPMAGMGRLESERMVALLDSLKRDVSILLIEHDMDAVFALADRIAVLVYGRIIATGSADQIRRDPAVREAYLGEGHG
ncbi:MAG: ABC transporter ATP-binding protein [Alphaproteobacteria bacterium]|nr:MAG: ABC transporter ATP-binding protein [Alphaproteobacteria bacterium]